MPETPDSLTDLESLLARLERIPSLDAAELEAEHVAILGRKQGRLTAILRGLPQLDPGPRAEVGRRANELKQRFEAAFEARREALRDAAAIQATAGVDLTMPGRGRWLGALHPVTQVNEHILQILHGLGFAITIGPEAETEWFNFGALNFTPDHPALDMHDTFYLDTRDRRQTEHERRRGRSSGIEQAFERRSAQNRRRPADEGRVLLRTHTSPVQIRTLLSYPPPVRVVIPGMVYRKDAFDPSHAPVFSQVEGLVVDRGIAFVDLKATLVHFAHRFFSPETRTRFRPSFFPFTEPSAEMDVSCTLCAGAGCPPCKGTGWMEILGCGMVHPAVLENCGIDAEEFTGFAFGMGPHRIAMQRFGIGDIRLLFEGDMRFLSQFGPLAPRS
jgi:phenylalanyl-tRNA synthetase alpha chain